MNSELLRGVLDLCVLVLARAEPVYGYRLLERLSAQGLDIAPGTVYPTLGRLRRRGLLEGRDLPGPTGQTRTYYSLTADGQHALQGMTADWERLQGAVGRLLLLALGGAAQPHQDQEALDA